MESNGDLEAYWTEQNERRTTFFEVYALFLEVLCPRWFLFENVPSIRSHPMFRRLENRFQNLKEVGGTPLQYRTHAANYRASHYGVPQDRRRFILVGHREILGELDWREPRRYAGATVRAALGDLPSVPNGHREVRVRYARVPRNPYQRLMRAEMPLGHAHSVTHHICRKNNSDDVALFERMKPGARFADPEVQAALIEINPAHKLLKYSTKKFSDKLHRLDPKRCSWTITAHLQKDCYKFIHYSQARTISVREAARLQSFPDRFSFGDLAMGPAFRIIGNAVPPLLAYAFAESFLEADPYLAQRRREAAEPEVSQEQWARVRPLLDESTRRQAVRRKHDPLAVLSGVLFVLRTGLPWELLLPSRGYASGLTCRMRYREWKRAGLWKRILIALRE